MSRMGMNIAAARRNAPKQHRLSPPEDHVTRTEGGRICPTCLAYGRNECTEHRPEPPLQNTPDVVETETKEGNDAAV